jgi:tyrosine-protein kinase Etk/Wzc
MNPSSQQSQNSIEKDEIDLAAYLEILLDHRWLIAAITAGFLLIGVLYTFLAKPIYRADLMVQVEQDSPDMGSGGNVISNVSSLFSVMSPTAGEIEILRSRLVVTRAVDRLKLYIGASPRYLPFIGAGIARRNPQLSTPGLFGWGGFAWGSEHITATVFNVPSEMEGATFTVTVLADQRYRLIGPHITQPLEGRAGRLERFQIPQGVVELQIDAIAARPGIEFNLVRNSREGIVEALQRGMVIEEKGKQQSNIIGATLEDTDPVRVSRILDEIGRQYVQQNVDRKSAEAEHSLTFLKTELPKMKQKLSDSEHRYNALRTKEGVVDLDAEGKMVLQQSADAQTQEFTLKQKRDDLIARFTSSHPAVAAIDDQITQLNKLVKQFDTQIKTMPDVEQQVLRLKLDVEVNKALYISLLQSAQQLSLMKAGKVGNVRVVDNPVVPEEPVKPVRPLVLAISLVAGLLVGFATAFARNMLFGGVTDPYEIERHTGMTVYATIPYSEPQREIARRINDRSPEVLLLALSHPHSPTIESFRSLRTALQFAMLDAKNNIVVLTGPAPGVGKSFISSNFAAVLASAGKRVLLIDADVRKGHLNQYLGIGREQGLSELVAGSITTDRAIRRNVVENLDFIPTGTLPPNPAELLLSSRLSDLLQQFSETYDVVMIDTPPVLAAADAGILALHAGAVFLISLAGTTKVGEITESTRRLGQSGAHVNGVLLNGMKPHTGRYGYGSKYGNYRYVAYTYHSDER